MKNKQALILIILSVAAIGSLLYGIMASSKSSPKPLAQHSAMAGKPGIANAKDITKVLRHAKMSSYSSWPKNPFSAPEVPEVFALKGIFWDKDNPKAIIGDEVVGIGDKAGSNKVIDIKEDRVILSNGKTEIELKLSE